MGGDGDGGVPVEVVGEVAQRRDECLPGLGVGGVVTSAGSFPGWWVRRRRWPGLRWGGEPLGAAGPGGVVGQGADVGVGQVGGLDPLRGCRLRR